MWFVFQSSKNYLCKLSQAAIKLGSYTNLRKTNYYSWKIVLIVVLESFLTPCFLLLHTNLNLGTIKKKQTTSAWQSFCDSSPTETNNCSVSTQTDLENPISTKQNHWN